MCVYVSLCVYVYVCTGGKVLLQWEKSYRVYGGTVGVKMFCIGEFQT